MGLHAVSDEIGGREVGALGPIDSERGRLRRREGLGWVCGRSRTRAGVEVGVRVGSRREWGPLGGR